MKQVLQSRSAFVTVRDVPPPECPPGGVLVRNSFSAISSGTERSRVELSSKSLLGKARERPDLVREVIDRARREGLRQTRLAVQNRLEEETAVGYSSAGVVIEVGEHCRGLMVGDEVACAGAGHASHAEIVSVPSNLCAPVPGGVSLQAASLTTIAAIALHGVRLAEATLGDRVAVVGCGLVGQITIRLLLAAGARVCGLDIDPEQMRAALESGAAEAFVADGLAAKHVIAATGGVGADAVIVTAAAKRNDPLLLGAAVARDRGRLVLVGTVPIDFPRAPLYDRELSFRVSRSYGPGRYDAEYEERGLDYPVGYVRWTEQRNMVAVLDLLARDRLVLDDLVDEVVPVGDAERAYRRLVDPEHPPRGALLLSYGGTGSSDASAAADSPQAGVPELSAVSVDEGDGAPEPIAGMPRLGLIGPGAFARRMILPAFLAAGAKPVVVGGGAGPSAASAQRSYGFARAAEDVEAVLSDPDTDIVAICTRHGAHATLAAQALRNGKHVFCEKPLALTADELEQVVAAAGGSRRVLAVGFNRRFAPLVRRAREFLSREPGPMVCNFRVSAGAIARDHWVHELAQGGGRLLGEACHFVDTIAFMVGAPVAEVYARGFARDGVPLQALDDALVTLTFADRSVGSLAYVASGSPKLGKERMEAFRGSRTVVLDDYLSLELLDGAARRTDKASSQDKGHRAEVAAFVDGVRAGRHPVPLAEIANVSLATLAIVESLRTGLPIQLRAG